VAASALTHPDARWKSDGTSAGTVLVKDIDIATGSALTNVNGTLFIATGELWKSDGTTAGTVLVKDIRPGLNDSNPTALTNVNGTLFFTANDGTTGQEVWKSDGTEPHGGIAFGLDRWVMMLAGTTNIREVIAFPKNAKARDMMTGAPAPVEPRQLKDLGLK